MDLADLYRDVILDHNRAPRNFRRMETPTRTTQGFNPLCGDKMTLYVQLDNGRISDISFEGSGCAISVASASLMTEALLGKTEEEAQALFARMRELLAGEDENSDGLGKLAALGGVRAFPSRVKCASLAWHALNAALEGAERASTE